MLFFDMIDDNYGIDSAIVLSTTYAVMIPVVVYAGIHLTQSRRHRSDDSSAVSSTSILAADVIAVVSVNDDTEFTVIS
jgi:hypothetical protein